MLNFVVLVIITAQIIANALVIPAFIAQAVNLDPVQVISGIIIFGNLLGALGVILAIPFIAVAKIVYANLYTDVLTTNRWI